MKKSPFVFLSAALLCSVLCGNAPAQEINQGDIPGLPEVQGRVAELDWVGNKLVVNTGGDEITFRLTSETEVEKNGEDISVSDINQSDVVTVRYVDKQRAGLVAVHITDIEPL